MTISISVLLILLATHYVADFVLQTDWQAQNKYRNVEALLSHVSVYTICFITVLAVLFPSNPAFPLTFGIVTWVAHALTDFITSKISHHFAEKTEWHNFFMVIGFDQLLHAAQLVLTYTLLTH